MNNEEDFKRSLNDLVESAEFEFSESDWEQASRLINRERRKRRALYLSLALSGLMMLLSGSYLYVDVLKNATQTAALANTSATPEIRNSEPAVAKQHPFPESSVPEVKRAAPVAQAASSDASEPVQEKIVTPRSKSPATGSTKPSQITEQPESDSNLPEEPIKESIATTEKKVPEPRNNNSPVSAISNGATEENVVKSERLYPVVLGSLPYQWPERNPTLVFVFEKESAVIPETPKQAFKGGLFYETGATWLTGWKYSGGRDASGINPVAGINYLSPVSKRLSASFGIQYTSAGNLSQSSKTSRITSYRFGEESKVTVITPSRLHYLNIPLRMDYRINKNNFIGVGYNLSYLLNVDVAVENYDEGPDYVRNHATSTSSGYTEGFRWYDTSLGFFYRRTIYRKLAAEAGLYMGMTDVKHDGFFGTDLVERNTGLRLTLIYNAFSDNRE